MIFKRVLALFILCTPIAMYAIAQNDNDSLDEKKSDKSIAPHIDSLGTYPSNSEQEFLYSPLFLKPKLVNTWNYIRPFSKYLINMLFGLGVSYGLYRYAPDKFPWIWAGTTSYTSLILSAAVVSYGKENQSLKEKSKEESQQLKELQEYCKNSEKMREDGLAWEQIAVLMKEKKELAAKLLLLQSYNEELITMNATYYQCMAEQQETIKEAQELIKQHKRRNEKLGFRLDQKEIELQSTQQRLARLKEKNKNVLVVLKDTQVQVENLKKGKNILSGIISRLPSSFWSGTNQVKA